MYSEGITQLIKERNNQKSNNLKNLSDNFSVLEKIVKSLIQMLEDHNLKGEIQSRIKTVYSIKQKMQNKNILHSQIGDFLGVRIIVKSIDECYQIMQTLIDHWTCVNSSIKDYIAIPKENGYQSIHLNILYADNPIEIQIRTQRMHQKAEQGLAAHNLYKKDQALKSKPL
jgi:(p)ppGpp synthase/HD superfamily hydrolase